MLLIKKMAALCLLFPAHAAAVVGAGDPPAIGVPQAVALSGQVAPGTGGDRYEAFTFGSPPSLAGHVLFRARLEGPNVSPFGFNEHAVFVGPVGGLQLFQREGAQVPGFPEFTVYFHEASEHSLTPAGTVLFRTDLRGPVITPGKNDIATFVGVPGFLAKVAQKGDPVPGLPGWVVQYPGYGIPDAQGRVSVFQQIASTAPGLTRMPQGLFFGPLGDTRPVAVQGEQAAGLPAGVVLDHVFAAARNERGDLAWNGLTRGPGVPTESFSSLAVWTRPEGAAEPVVVARGTDPAVGGAPGETYILYRWLSLLEDGEVSFSGWISSGASPASPAIWTGKPGATRLVVRAPAPAPETAAGVNYGSFEWVQQNDDHDWAWMSGLVGTGVNTGNNRAIFAGKEGAMRLVARTGADAPGTDALFDVLDINDVRLVLNDLGQVAFHARLRGSGVNTSNDQGYWATTPDGELIKVIREGDLFDVGNGDLRVVLSFGQPQFGDGGQVALHASFTDGSSGIFLINVPEPAAAAGMAAAGMWLLLLSLTGRRTARRRPS